MAIGAVDGDPAVKRASARPKMRLSPVGFWSYSRRDDELSRGRLSQLRSLLLAELQTQSGLDGIQIFQDVSAIPPGTDWERATTEALSKANFFIPIVTPHFIQSPWCTKEVHLFLAREQALLEQYPDLPRESRIFPLYLIDIEDVEPLDAEVLAALRVRQWCDFTKLRHRRLDDESVMEKLTEIAGSIRRLLQIRAEPPATKEERDRLAGKEQAERDELTRRQQEIEAAQAEALRRAEEAAMAKSEAAKAKREQLAAERIRLRAERLARLRELLHRPAVWFFVLVPAAALAFVPIFISRPWTPPSESGAALNETLALPAARQEDGSAELAAGDSLRDGVGTRIDYSRAMAAYRQAAEHGNADAFARVGEMYRFGYGVPISFAQALEWFRLGAARNSADAQYNLGYMYAVGDGVPLDEVESQTWYQRAMAGYLTRRNDPAVQKRIGEMHHDGLGVPRDQAEAMRWYHRAAEHGDADAMLHIAYNHEYGWDGQRDQAQADSWYRRAMTAYLSQQGNVHAQMRIANLYLVGSGVSKDFTESTRWTRRAAEQNDPFAQHLIGSCYTIGNCATRDPAQAMSWWRRSAAQNRIESIVAIARTFYDDKQFAEAAAWYRRAAEQDGEGNAQKWLADMYRRGEGVPRDLAQAAMWYRRAAGNRVSSAKYELAVILLSGAPGVAQDRAEAERLMRAAAAGADTDARQWLAAQSLPVPEIDSVTARYPR